MNALLPRPCAPDLDMPRPAAETPEGRVLCLAFVLLPGFDMLALMAGTEPFRLAERLGRRGTFRILLLSADRAPVLSAQGVAMAVDDGISDAVKADITLVVGGEVAKASLPSVLTGHLRRIWRQGKRVGRFTAASLPWHRQAFWAATALPRIAIICRCLPRIGPS